MTKSPTSHNLLIMQHNHSFFVVFKEIYGHLSTLDILFGCAVWTVEGF